MTKRIDDILMEELGTSLEASIRDELKGNIAESIKSLSSEQRIELLEKLSEHKDKHDVKQEVPDDVKNLASKIMESFNKKDAAKD